MSQEQSQQVNPVEELRKGLADLKNSLSVIEELKKTLDAQAKEIEELKKALDHERKIRKASIKLMRLLMNKRQIEAGDTSTARELVEEEPSKLELKARKNEEVRKKIEELRKKIAEKKAESVEPTRTVVEVREPQSNDIRELVKSVLEGKATAFEVSKRLVLGGGK